MTNYHTNTENFDPELFRIFDELDGIILDCLPESLTITPVDLIRQICREKFGVDITQQEICSAFHRYDTMGGRYYAV